MNIMQIRNNKTLVQICCTAYIVYTFNLTLHHANFGQFKAKQVLLNYILPLISGWKSSLLFRSGLPKQSLLRHSVMIPPQQNHSPGIILYTSTRKPYQIQGFLSKLEIKHTKSHFKEFSCLVLELLKRLHGFWQKKFVVT